jgi:hypothetical protein
MLEFDLCRDDRHEAGEVYGDRRADNGGEGALSCGVLVLATATAAAEDMAYSVTVTGACKSQMFAGWDDCQGTATYTAFKNGKYNFRFIDKNNNVYVLAGGKDRQLDVSKPLFEHRQHGHHHRRQESRGFTSDGWVQYEAQFGRREVRLYRLRRVQLQDGILQVQDHQHHGCGASLRAVKFGLPRRLRDGHGPGVFAIPIRWSAAIGEACGWRGIARTKGHGEIHMAHRAAGKGHREQ